MQLYHCRSIFNGLKSGSLYTRNIFIIPLSEYFRFVAFFVSRHAYISSTYEVQLKIITLIVKKLIKIKKSKEIDKNVVFLYRFLFLVEFYSYTENISTKRHCTKEMNKKRKL